ncbi:hypothetical protein H6S82_21385 [Planktothrix sp. FACHB-1355]|uniref:Uncharacterized protein n=1 Tax=Aerosakkonema funiforme FACHB-1375 TaxID=2949571 RepID=A0A926VFH7_9CYAN|nr:MULTISPECIES: hypothetical protein [Oscillatoriales]MBD2182758.1 hypothetical protein [Aerosakkonema funiforme FACHB-1375]MBD3561373.1 hypothetical protein [Planktothrix sp. FACHB-1355]
MPPAPIQTQRLTDVRFIQEKWHCVQPGLMFDIRTQSRYHYLNRLCEYTEVMQKSGYGRLRFKSTLL